MNDELTQRECLAELKAIRALLERIAERPIEPEYLPPILDVRDAAARLHLLPTTVRRLAKAGKIPHIIGPDGKEMLFPEPLLAKWLREQPVK